MTNQRSLRAVESFLCHMTAEEKAEYNRKYYQEHKYDIWGVKDSREYVQSLADEAKKRASAEVQSRLSDARRQAMEFGNQSINDGVATARKYLENNQGQLENMARGALNSGAANGEVKSK